MTYSNTLGALLQGVSQQPPAIRPQGRVSEQINFVPDVVQGLTARPGLRHTADITGSPAGLAFFDAEIDGDPYIIGYKAGEIVVWGTDGTEWPVTYQDAAAQAYIGTDLRGYVHDSTLYVTNREVVVALAGSLAPVDTFDNVGLAYCLGGKFSRTYSVTINYADGLNPAVGSYTTPDGTATGDADKTSSTYIMGQIKTALLAHGNFRVGTTAELADTTLYVHHTSAFTLAVSDGDNSTAMRQQSQSVDDVEFLAPYAPHGTLVRVTGSDAGVKDDYWLRFNSAVTSALGNGFGKPGVWEEWYDVSEVSEFDTATMPHLLRWNGVGFTFERVGWLPRRTGDSTTNEFPDFVGHPIRDINGFQSRLVIVAGPFCCMSRTNTALDFFKKSATTDLVTDTISIASTKEGSTRLDWIIPFDRDLVFMSDPGKGQFVITAGDLLTPQNASMAQTTAFEMRGGAAPVQTGRTIVFPFKTGKYSGLKEFFTNDEVATNGADTLTETLDRYVEGLVTHLTCSTNLNTILLRTDGAAVRDTIWVYSYLWQGTEKVQGAWHKWVLPGDVEHFYFSGSEITVVLWHAATSSYTVNKADIDLPEDEDVGYHVCLDRQRAAVVTAGVVDLPFPNATFAQSLGCPAIGSEASATAADLGGGQWRYTLNPDAAPEGATVVAGQKYLRMVKPTMPFMRDREGNVKARGHVVVSAFYIDYQNCGALDVIQTGPWREPSTISVNWFPLADDPLRGPSGIRSGILEVPWGERSDWSELTIQSDDIRPTTILEVEWSGQPFTR